MDKEKEGLITSVPEALTEAAKINMAAAKEMASSAVTAIVDTVTGRASKGKETCFQEESFDRLEAAHGQEFRRDKACCHQQAQGQQNCRQETYS
jgi:hypothetical protein